jgi:lysophospholipase L1-like esterase
MLSNTVYRLKKEKKLTVAYFGGSITEACGWRVKIKDYLRASYPEAEITEVNAAISGTGSLAGLYRCDTDLLSLKPNLVFIEFAVNDSFFKYSAITVNFESIIRKSTLPTHKLR